MAIGLSEIGKSKPKSTKSLPTQSATNQDKSMIARPWESFDKLGIQARTVSANEAIRNIGKIRDNTNVLDFRPIRPAKIKSDMDYNKVTEQVNSPCISPGLLGFLKRLFIF